MGGKRRGLSLCLEEIRQGTLLSLGLKEGSKGSPDFLLGCLHNSVPGLEGGAAETVAPPRSKNCTSDGISFKLSLRTLSMVNWLQEGKK